MDARLLRHTLAPAVGPGRNRRARRRAPAVPYAAHLVTGDDLCESARLDVANLDEARVEEQDVWRVPGNMFSSAFPLNSLHGAVLSCPAWVSMTVNVETEFCAKSASHSCQQRKCRPTVIAQQEFVFTRAEHSHRPT